jgi:hypothetical protein
MPYYIRLISRSAKDIPFADMVTCVGENLSVEIDDGTPENWSSVTIKSPDGTEICLIEKTGREIMEDEISEFIEEMADAEPPSGAEWVVEYLGSVKSLYACQFLEPAFGEEYGGVPSQILWNMKWILGTGILQSDGEGFSNEDGYDIVWQFSDNVKGSWGMGVLDDDGKWVNFRMDLGNKAHRAAFRAGKIPDGVTIEE